MASNQNQITDEDLILVTGASGFIATHIVKQLLEKGYRVRGTVRSLKDEKKCAPLRKLAENRKFELELVEADLTKEETWKDAVKDCTYVLHTASPLPLQQPKDENELVVPAVNGTLFVLRASVNVKRVVLTSSMAAICGDTYISEHTYSENDWSEPNKLGPYYKSKTLAEKAAWDFVEQRKNNGLSCFELAVINPSMVMVIKNFKRILCYLINILSIRILENCYLTSYFVFLECNRSINTEIQNKKFPFAIIQIIKKH